MNYTENKQNLFSVSSEYYIAHCIAEDLKMSAGIAVDIQKKFHVRGQILKGTHDHRFPACILTGRVFNLITKKKSTGKPNYESMRAALMRMRSLCVDHAIEKVAMPKIGCGLDRLSWPAVRGMLYGIFMDLDVDILVCHL